MLSVSKRYQHWTKDGITWSKWFKFKELSTRKEAEEYIKTLPEKTNKLLNEYRIDL